MRKLTTKIKYNVVDDHAELFAVHKTSGKWAKFATCHLATLDYIEKHGLQAAMDLGCIRWI